MMICLMHCRGGDGEMTRMEAFVAASNLVPWRCICVTNRSRTSIKASSSIIDNNKNRKQLQRGRTLSIEAIHAIQALKRANPSSLRHVISSKFSRLLKSDMIAVLRELLRQNQCFLALQVFEDIRKELWYKPQVSLYNDMIMGMASNGLWEQVELLYMYLKAERNLEPQAGGFHSLLQTFMTFNLTALLMDCYQLMKATGCEPDRPTFALLINGLQSAGESDASDKLREDARKYYGESLDFLEEEGDGMTVSRNLDGKLS